MEKNKTKQRGRESETWPVKQTKRELQQNSMMTTVSFLKQWCFYLNQNFMSSTWPRKPAVITPVGPVHWKSHHLPIRATLKMWDETNLNNLQKKNTDSIEKQDKTAWPVRFNLGKATEKCSIIYSDNLGRCIKKIKQNKQRALLSFNQRIFKSWFLALWLYCTTTLKESDGECYQTDYCVSETTYSYIQATLSMNCGHSEENSEKKNPKCNCTWIHCLQCVQENLKLRFYNYNICVLRRWLLRSLCDISSSALRPSATVTFTLWERCDCINCLGPHWKNDMCSKILN